MPPAGYEPSWESPLGSVADLQNPLPLLRGRGQGEGAYPPAQMVRPPHPYPLPHFVGARGLICLDASTLHPHIPLRIRGGCRQ